MLAPDGRCKVLDTDASGYVRAEAVGILALRCVMLVAGVEVWSGPRQTSAGGRHGLPQRPRSSSFGRGSNLYRGLPTFLHGHTESSLGPQKDSGEEDKQSMLAIVHGAAINQDGRSSSLTAPNGPAQQALISSALAAANTPPAKVWQRLHLCCSFLLLPSRPSQ